VLTEIRNRMGAISGVDAATFVVLLVGLALFARWITAKMVDDLHRIVKHARTIPSFMGTPRPLPLPDRQWSGWMHELEALWQLLRDVLEQFNVSRASGAVTSLVLPVNPFFGTPLPWLLGQPQRRPISAPAGRFVPPPDYADAAPAASVSVAYLSATAAKSADEAARSAEEATKSESAMEMTPVLAFTQPNQPFGQAYSLSVADAPALVLVDRAPPPPFDAN
jgi:hypothetical protein